MGVIAQPVTAVVAYSAKVILSVPRGDSEVGICCVGGIVVTWRWLQHIFVRVLPSCSALQTSWQGCGHEALTLTGPARLHSRVIRTSRELRSQSVQFGGAVVKKR